MQLYESFKRKPFNLTDEDVKWVDDTLCGLTKEEKAGQLFCTIVRTGTEEDMILQKELFQPGGMMYRPLSVEEAVSYTNALKKYFKVPILIAANLEKGGDGIVYEGTHLGSPMAIAATDDVENAHRLGMLCGAQSRAVGGNWAFAPIIDIDYNWRNPITNTRTFGSDPKRVAEMGAAYVKGVQSGGVAASIKHFPGDGMDERDQHLVVSVNSASVDEWDATYGEAYKAGIDAGAMTVMVGHFVHPEYSRTLRPGIRDEDIMPATLAPEIMGDLLRGKLGFNGLVVTDATTMNGFTSMMSRSKAVPYSIAAGADMFLFCKNTEEDFGFMMAGINDGVITPQRLDEAVARILALKAALGLHKENKSYTVQEARTVLHNPVYKDWVKEIADKAVTLVKEQPGVLPLNTAKNKVLLYPIKPDAPSFFGGRTNACERFKELLEAEGFDVTVFEPENLFEGKTKKAAEFEAYDYMIYIAAMSTKSNQTVVRIEWKQPMGADCPAYIANVPTIFVSVENPYHLIDVPRVKTFINAYDSSDEMLEAIVDKLMGRSKFKGVSPVDAFCGCWDTHL